MKETDLLNICGVNESFDVPVKLLELLLSPNSDQLLEQISNVYGDLQIDEFNIYYQTYLSERGKLKQDYTPNEVGKLLGMLIGETDTLIDVCAGSGTLTINYWSEHPNVKVCCEEFSSRVIPFLLANLALRNIDGIVYHGDTLTRKYEHIYRLCKGDKYSTIQIVEESKPIEGAVIMNPPYSLGWNPMNDERFNAYELAPKSKADYAFLLHGLSLLSENDRMAIILPHGVLFRAQSEGKIREALIKDNLIDTIIGIPLNMFMNTSIPTCILVLNKKKKSNDILFIDASDKCFKDGKFNRFSSDDLQQIYDAYSQRKQISKFSYVATLQDLETNQYNCNIPRYVDKYEKAEPIDIVSVTKDLFNLLEQAEETMVAVANQLDDLKASTPFVDEQLKYVQKEFGKYRAKKKKETKGNQISLW